jgi:Ca2+-binding EF-hand superfamily protein
VTIQKCFGFIDDDNSSTISLEELKAAMIRFRTGLSEKEIKMFLQLLDEDRKGYITE